MKEDVKIKVHVYSDGGTELQKVSTRKSFDWGTDLLFDTYEALQLELESYGFEEDRIDRAFKELKEAGINDTVEV